MQDKFNVAVIISGRGSNLQALLQNQQNFEIKAVISDKKEAYGLKYAQDANISCIKSFTRENFNSKIEQKNAIYSCIRSLKLDLICLAGFMQIVESNFVEEYYGKLINIHPSLLPELSGLDTHRRALEKGKIEHGCTVHYIDSGVDSGPKIAQAKCDISKNETIDTLSAKVLNLEHKLYPWVVNSIANKDIILDRTDSKRGNVTFSSQAKSQAQKNLFYI